MKLGYLVSFNRDEPGRARRLGFDSLELHASSWFGNDIYSDKKQRQEIVDQLKAAREEFGISVSAIANYWPAIGYKGKELTDSMKKAIDIAEACGAGVVTAIVGREDKNKSIKDNIPAWAKGYASVAKAAEDKGVRIGFENWPAFGGYPMTGQTMAITPEAWEAMFDALPSKALGLEFDPSHLYWQEIDHMAALRKFADRVVHVHAKDTEIFYDKRDHVGIYGDGWWTYRIPGLGEIDWNEFMAGLHSIGYKGGIAIEHEDGRFDAGRQKADLKEYEQGLKIGLATLRPLAG